MMKPRAPFVLGGLLVALVFHGALAAAYVAYSQGRVSLDEAMLQSERAMRQKRLNLCDKYRCPRVEGRQRRRHLEESPLDAPEILEAAMIPALGGVTPDPRRLPEIETVEQAARVEDAINIGNQDPELKKLLKADKPKEAKLDPLSNTSPLDQFTSNDDPRANAKSLENLTGVSTGEIGGQGSEWRPGHEYSRRVARAIKPYFTVPPFIDEVTLKSLKVKVKVTRMSVDGSVLAFRVVSKSGDTTFDDAAINAIKKFSEPDGGSKKLPPPDTKVLAFINAKGLDITLDGRLASH
ncbi:MAG: hypothetical protein EP329_16235 [Deltaproteobacteria bacterium]|nr:MAG: hypothetical protein EP329_16235 [Deltaproteobacteria bacterium]